MSDLVYGGGGGGGGYYPPSFDPNNPMGNNGTPNNGGGSVSPQWADTSYYAGAVRYADPAYNNDYFYSNINAKNPYQQYYDITAPSHTVIRDQLYASGNEIVQISDYVLRVYNNAYTDFENKATSAQNEYLTTQTTIQNNNIDTGKSDLVASYGNVKDSSIASKIERLGDLTAQYEKLKFEDDITKFLNRVPDSNNTSQLESLLQQINDLGNELFRELTDYWRKQENIRREQRQDFSYNFNWLTDPYFGQSPFYAYKTLPFQINQNQHTFLNLHTSGDMVDWMAGGNMYDSPRAGNILFNPLGSLNTTVFLGLENQNFSPLLPSTLANPEVFRKLGTLAGDSGFSVLNFGIKK